MFCGEQQTVTNAWRKKMEIHPAAMSKGHYTVHHLDIMSEVKGCWKHHQVHCWCSLPPPTVWRWQWGCIPGWPIPGLWAGRSLSSRPGVRGQKPVGVQAVFSEEGCWPSAQRTFAPPSHSDVYTKGLFLQKHRHKKTEITNKRIKLTVVAIQIIRISIMDDIQKCVFNLFKIIY